MGSGPSRSSDSSSEDEKSTAAPTRLGNVPTLPSSSSVPPPSSSVTSPTSPQPPVILPPVNHAFASAVPPLFNNNSPPPSSHSSTTVSQLSSNANDRPTAPTATSLLTTSLSNSGNGNSHTGLPTTTLPTTLSTLPDMISSTHVTSLSTSTPIASISTFTTITSTSTSTSTTLPPAAAHHPTSPSQTSSYCYSDNEIDDKHVLSDSDSDSSLNSVSNSNLSPNPLSTLDRTPSLDSFTGSLNSSSTSNQNQTSDDFLGLPLSMSIKSPTKSPPSTSRPLDLNSPDDLNLDSFNPEEEDEKDEYDLSQQILRSPSKTKLSPSSTTKCSSPSPTSSPKKQQAKPKEIAPARPHTTITVNFSDPKTSSYVTSSLPPATSKNNTLRNPRPTSIRTQPLIPEGYSKNQWETEVLTSTKPLKKRTFVEKFLRSKTHGVRVMGGGGKGGLRRLEELSGRAVEALDEQTGGIVTLMKKLRDKVSLDTTVPDLAIRLIDTSQASPSTNSEKMDFSRRVFVMLDGPELVIELFNPSSNTGGDCFEGRDAREDLDKREVKLKSNYWNEALVLLRELSYLHPNIASDFITKHFLIYLFTMTSHSCIFECTVGLIEEILSLLPPTNLFDVSEVPAFYDLLSNLSCKQMGHFCRVMALLVFEPEDRVLMESSTALKSMSLLQLRRDRTSRGSTNIDKNQSVLLGMEEMLQRLVDLLKVLNYAPGLDRLTSYHVIAHVPSVSELLVSIGVSEVESWDDLERMDKLAKRALNNPPPTPASPPSPSPSTLSSPGSATSSQSPTTTASAATPTTPTQPNPATPSAQPSSLGSISPMLESLAPHLNSGRWDMEIIVHALNAAHRLNIIRESSSNGPTETGTSLLRRLNALAMGRRRTATTPSEAANDLQFTALLLAQYQVEILFVLCTLLGGRRKLAVQKQLSTCNVISVLDGMFDRLSWGKVDNEASQMSRIHGPGCECNPESALRVQYLRLLHNYCDRDCDNYEGKREMLSPDEKKYLRLRAGRKCNWDWLDEPFEGKKGLLSKLIVVLMKEPNDSIYRFWLASAVEAYLRGATDVEQVYVARSGLLDHLTEEILSDRLRCAGSLQTSFDLLGELIKGNAMVLNMMVKGLDEESFERMMVVSTSNLVDSNVFIRSLTISLEREKYRKKQKKKILKYGPKPIIRSYLTHSWWDVESISSKRERDPFDFNSDDDDDSNSGSDSASNESDLNSSSPEPPELELHRKKPVNPNQIWIDDVNWYDDYEPRNNTVSRIRSASSVDLGTESTESDMWSTPTKSVDSIGDGGVIGEEQDIEIVSPSTEDLMTVGPTGWKFSPQSARSRTSSNQNSSPRIHELAFEPNTLSRINWFLAANQTRLLRELMKVVSLHNVNHENICVLNTVIVFFIFINRKNEGNLERVLQELRDTELAEKAEGKLGAGEKEGDDGEDIAALDDLDNYDHVTTPNQSGIMCNFRELLFFWREYYSHRGRDRLSLEFSSHLRFVEWKTVVDLLCADDGSPCSLVPSKISLPRSPYSRTPRN